MSKKRQEKKATTEALELLALICGASVGNSGTQTLLSAAESFAAGLKSSHQAHAALSTVQLSALTDCLVALRRPVAAAPVATAATAGYIAGANALPPGAPVVT